MSRLLYRREVLTNKLTLTLKAAITCVYNQVRGQHSYSAIQKSQS